MQGKNDPLAVPAAALAIQLLTEMELAEAKNGVRVMAAALCIASAVRHAGLSERQAVAVLHGAFQTYDQVARDLGVIGCLPPRIDPVTQ